MKNFKAVSMDCNKEQFETIREELIALGCEIYKVEKFEENTLLVNNFFSVEKKITNLDYCYRDNKRQYLGAFDKEAFLQACGKVEEKQSGWYKHNNYQDELLYWHFEDRRVFGFDFENKWVNLDPNVIKTFTKNVSKSTEEQVLKRLTEESEKRGYIGKDLKIKLDGKEYLLEKEKGSFQVASNLFLYQGATIMSNGIWAEIVPNNIEVVEPVNVSELAELKKEKTSLLKSRNRYKQLYIQEKSIAYALVKDISRLAIENSNLQKGEVFLIQEVRSFEKELYDKKEANEDLYRKNCLLELDNNRLKKQLKLSLFAILLVVASNVVYMLC